jgi:hypothetical protein
MTTVGSAVLGSKSYTRGSRATHSKPIPWDETSTSTFSVLRPTELFYQAISFVAQNGDVIRGGADVLFNAPCESQVVILVLPVVCD